MQLFPPQPVNFDDVRKHMLGSYTSLRLGLAIVAFAFPWLLLLVGHFHHVPLQDSFSAYYWSGGKALPVRVWFAGGLLVLAFGLYFYKGFTSRENIALNLAGMGAIGVVVFPMPWKCAE